MRCAGRGGNIGARAEARIDQPARVELVHDAAIVGEMIGLAAHLAVPGKPQPTQVGQHRGLVLAAAAADVDIFYADEESAADVARALPGDAGGIGAAEMKFACRAGGKPRDGGHDPTLQRTLVACYGGSNMAKTAPKKTPKTTRIPAPSPASGVILDKKTLKTALAELAAADPDIARALDEAGHPELREMPTGYGGLMRSIVGQQVSVDAARSIWLRLEAAVPSMVPADFFGDERRAAPRRRSFRRQGEVRPQPRHRHRRGPHRLRYVARARRCCRDRHADASQGHRPVDRRDLPDVRARPARHHAGSRPRPRGGGTASQGLRKRPDAKRLLKIAEAWRPWRSAAALVLWHYRRNMPDWSAPKTASAKEKKAT